MIPANKRSTRNPPANTLLWVNPQSAYSVNLTHLTAYATMLRWCDGYHTIRGAYDPGPVYGLDIMDHDKSRCTEVMNFFKIDEQAAYMRGKPVVMERFPIIVLEVQNQIRGFLKAKPNGLESNRVELKYERMTHIIGKKAKIIIPAYVKDSDGKPAEANAAEKKILAAFQKQIPSKSLDTLLPGDTIDLPLHARSIKGVVKVQCIKTGTYQVLDVSQRFF